MTRKIIKGLGLLLVISLIGISVIYMISRHNILNQLEAESQIAQTAVGLIQYSLIGDKGPVILHLHGTPGGFNHTPFFTTSGFEEFRLLTPSRPGYMATPLEVGKTPDEQARAYAALLDELQIDEVVVLGTSGGGPSAISFAAMYPHRTLAFVGLEIESQPFSEPLDIPLFMKSDFLYWLVMSIIANGDESLPPFFSQEDSERIMNSPDGIARIHEWLWSAWPLVPKLTGWQNDSEQFMNLSLTPQLIKAPTLILHGTEDEQVLYESAELLASEIANARLYTVEGGNHAMLLSHKEELNLAITTFLLNVLSEEY